MKRTYQGREDLRLKRKAVFGRGPWTSEDLSSAKRTIKRYMGGRLGQRSWQGGRNAGSLRVFEPSIFGGAWIEYNYGQRPAVLER